MQNIWAPWRIEYILGQKPDACVFCLSEDKTLDRERLILYRGEHCFVIMNRYPYNNGHLMISPYRHVSCITELNADEAAEMMALTQKCTTILKSHFKTQGVNIGYNIGSAAGAGIKDHLHCHLVPRWNGDANFITVLADVHTIPQHLDETYAALLPLFN